MSVVKILKENYMQDQLTIMTSLIGEMYDLCMELDRMSHTKCFEAGNVLDRGVKSLETVVKSLQRIRES